ncbi:MAG: hypothetical protein IT577_23165 [Verrucomicrobiae bacterium]|nr:hypothetical protein [Verrucomicrobiae bacterium]
MQDQKPGAGLEVEKSAPIILVVYGPERQSDNSTMPVPAAPTMAVPPGPVEVPHEPVASTMAGASNQTAIVDASGLVTGSMPATGQGATVRVQEETWSGLWKGKTVAKFTSIENGIVSTPRPSEEAIIEMRITQQGNFLVMTAVSGGKPMTVPISPSDPLCASMTTITEDGGRTSAIWRLKGDQISYSGKYDAVITIPGGELSHGKRFPGRTIRICTEGGGVLARVKE